MEVKKGKSSEINQKNNEQAKFSPSLKVWSHEGVKVAVKFEKQGQVQGALKVVLFEMKGPVLLQRHAQVMISQFKSPEVIKISSFGHMSLLL